METKHSSYCYKHEFDNPCPICNMKVYVPSKDSRMSPGDIQPRRVPDWLRIGTLKDTSKDIAKARSTSDNT